MVNEIVKSPNNQNCNCLQNDIQIKTKEDEI
jgi:hypothetical protein